MNPIETLSHDILAIGTEIEQSARSLHENVQPEERERLLLLLANAKAALTPVREVMYGMTNEP